MVELATDRAARIEADAHAAAQRIISEARTKAASLMSAENHNSLPLSLVLESLAVRAAEEEKQRAVLIQNAEEAAKRPVGRLLSDATLPEIISEMARRMST